MCGPRGPNMGFPALTKVGSAGHEMSPAKSVAPATSIHAPKVPLFSFYCSPQCSSGILMCVGTVLWSSLVFVYLSATLAELGCLADVNGSS